MLLIIEKKLSDSDLQKVAEDLKGYIKVVVDIDQQILAAGGLRHVDGEQLLLRNGSRQENLWGGGLDLETHEIDFDSMINLRPSQGNTSREILSEGVRIKMIKIVRKLLK